MISAHSRKWTLMLKQKSKFKNQAELFRHIWDTREHVSGLSDKPLEYYPGHSLWHWQFLHILPKGTYPAYKLLEKNIVLGLKSEHEKQDSIPEFLKLREELTRQYYAEVYNKEFD